MFTARRRILSQNFLYSRKLVNQLVRRSSLGYKDTVLEIGPGKGIITEQLLSLVSRVIAIELDAELCTYISGKFHGAKNFQLIQGDFLNYRLPRHSYKVFANIPFSIEGKIIRKLLTAENPPEDCYLVVRRDLAERLAGIQREGQFSIMYKPFFSFEIVHYFRRTDFEPMARMDTVLLRFRKRSKPLVDVENMQKYMQFVGQGFGGGRDLKRNLKPFFSREQFRRLSNHWMFSIHARPSELTVEQWIAIYSYYSHTVLERHA